MNANRPLSLAAHLVRSAATSLILLAASNAHANDAQECRISGGTLLVGQVVAPLKFKHGMYKKGVELSHTHLKLRGEDGNIYDIAIDNVFADGYQENTRRVPAPLSSIAVGDRIEACGIAYRGGMHWVHNSCGDRPSRSDPDGWLKVIQADGRVGPNLESSQRYCGLWPRR